MEIGWSTKNSLQITSHSAGQSRATLCNDKHTHAHADGRGHSQNQGQKTKNGLNHIMALKNKDHSARSYSLLGVSLEQGVVGEHKSSVRAQQDAVSDAGHRVRLGWFPVVGRVKKLNLFCLSHQKTFTSSLKHDTSNFLINALFKSFKRMKICHHLINFFHSSTKNNGTIYRISVSCTITKTQHLEKNKVNIKFLEILQE